jgi:outer membrane protein
MMFRVIISRKLFLAGITASTLAGCASPSRFDQSFDQRVLPPSLATSPQPTKPLNGDGVKQVRADQPATASPPMPTSPGEPAPPISDPRSSATPLSLSDAIALAFRLQPRLRVFLEGVVQSKGAETVALAPFLPSVVAGYSAGGFDLNVGGPPGPAGSQNVTFLPPAGVLPLGLNLNTGYELAELRVQWILADFGRRMGRYRQAELGVSVSQLQTDRAYQLVANEVALAYYQVLRARSLKRTAEEAVRRSEDDLDVAKKLEKGGVIEREKVLRTEVLLAQARRGLDAAEASVENSVAALNLAIGLNVNAPTEVVGSPALPEFGLSLVDCLSQAVAQRRELEVAQLTIRSAQIGGQVARADFRPKIVADGALIDLQQSAPRAHADLAVGSIKLEWGLFEGGRCVGELRIADSKLRAAAAQAESMADTIAFQVNEAYRQLIVARRGIDRSKPAVEQAQEGYRLLRARAAKGDATPAEVTDAETSLTRADQDYLNSTYDYLSALARLKFAMGISAIPADSMVAVPPGRP